MFLLILLNANTETKQTFEKVIETMGENVKWTGLIAVLEDYLILQGEVRSLFFHFENKKVATNIIDIPVNQEEVIELVLYPKVQNVLNMTLYAFGKWGMIKGLRVDQDYAKLDQLFAKILEEIYVEPAFSREKFRFYKEGIRLTFEDVVQAMLEVQQKPAQEPELAEEEKQGLWHKLIWKKLDTSFQKVETTLAERRKERLGHNFYLVGYLCPKCKQKMHMVVFPEGKELLVDTEEGKVYLARAYACDHCNCFYTPRPKKLLAEGACYEMPFLSDRKAYEDYLELLGERGENTSNYHFNEFVKDRNAKPVQSTKEQGSESAKEELADLCERLEKLPDLEFSRLKARIEEGFFPHELIQKQEEKIKEQTKKRQKKNKYDTKEQMPGEKQSGQLGPKQRETGRMAQRRGAGSVVTSQRTPDYEGEEKIAYQKEHLSGSTQAVPEDVRILERRKKAAKEKKENYETRMNLWERLSPRQRQELILQIKNEPLFDDVQKKTMLTKVQEKEQQGRMQELEKRADAAENYGYVQLKRVADEIKGAEVPKEFKESLLDRIKLLLREKGEKEVRQLMEQMPQNLDRKGYQRYVDKLKEYEDVDMTPYQKELQQRREGIETQELGNLVKRARKISREDYVDLLKKIQEGDFLPENAAPFIEKIRERIKEKDADEIAGICKDISHMDFDAAAKAYEKISQGAYLPELKVDALEMLVKRLTKIKADECELLVSKLKDAMDGKIKENPRHHFYPARKVLLKEATEEEMQVIDYALGTYATKRKPFEYPILVVDTSRNESGKEGIILTPEHLFYSTILNAYGIPIQTIRSVKANTGLLGRGITVEQHDGTKTKIPYAVETSEMTKWAKILSDFIAYLQEKPESRNVTYLAKEKHETICCFRCGYTYKGGNVCPKCGYKMNR